MNKKESPQMMPSAMNPGNHIDARGEDAVAGVMEKMVMSRPRE
jgi:hypothetical protein